MSSVKETYTISTNCDRVLFTPISSTSKLDSTLNKYIYVTSVSLVAVKDDIFYLFCIKDKKQIFPDFVSIDVSVNNSTFPISEWQNLGFFIHIESSMLSVGGKINMVLNYMFDTRCVLYMFKKKTSSEWSNETLISDLIPGKDLSAPPSIPIFASRSLLASRGTAGALGLSEPESVFSVTDAIRTQLESVVRGSNWNKPNSLVGSYKSGESKTRIIPQNFGRRVIITPRFNPGTPLSMTVNGVESTAWNPDGASTIVLTCNSGTGKIEKEIWEIRCMNPPEETFTFDVGFLKMPITKLVINSRDSYKVKIKGRKIYTGEKFSLLDEPTQFRHKEIVFVSPLYDCAVTVLHGASKIVYLFVETQ